VQTRASKAPGTCQQSGEQRLCIPADNCWTGWSAWSTCSSACGVGTHVRTRQRDPLCNPQCGTNSESTTCIIKPCVDCQNGPWSQWSSCTATCGDRTKSRNRTNIPADGGLPCADPNTTQTIPCEYISCGSASCPEGWTVNLENSFLCDDIDECAEAAAEGRFLCGDICHNLPGTYECRCSVGSYLTPPFNVNCTERPCPLTNWSRIETVWNEETTPFPQLLQVDRAFHNRQEFMGCSACNNGFAKQTRFILDEGLKFASCIGVQLERYGSCSFPCLNASLILRGDVRNAVIQQLTKDDFLNQTMKSLLGPGYPILMSLSNSSSIGKRQAVQFEYLAITFTIVPNCTRSVMNNVSRIVDGLVAGIAPDAYYSGLITYETNPNGPNSSCQFRMLFRDKSVNYSATAAVSGVLGVFAFLALLLLLALFLRRRQYLKQLPPPVAWQYLQYYYSMGLGWKYSKGTVKGTGYYHKKLSSGTEGYRRVMGIYNHYFHGIGLEPKRVHAIFNKTLTNSFIAHRQIMTERTKTNAKLFKSQSWRQSDTATVNRSTRDHVSQQLEKRINDLDWNRDPEWSEVPIIPLIHGTDLTVARLICTSGFASLSSLDAGFYGRGIYFTSCAWYALPYFLSRRDPTIIISWVTLGNAYPVIESPNAPDSLCGAAIKAGYNSHYVLTNKKGHPVGSKDIQGQFGKQVFDEVVITQEAQITPAFLVELEVSNGEKLLAEWTRDMPNPSGDPYATRQDAPPGDSILVTNRSRAEEPSIIHSTKPPPSKQKGSDDGASLVSLSLTQTMDFGSDPSIMDVDEPRYHQLNSPS